MSYSPALGRLMSRKALIQNKYSEKGYRYVKLNIDGETTSSEDQVSILYTSISVLFVNTFSHPLLLSHHLEEDKAAMHNKCYVRGLYFTVQAGSFFAVERAATIVDSLSNKFILRCHDRYDEFMVTQLSTLM